MGKAVKPRKTAHETFDEATSETRRRFLSEREAAAYIGMSGQFLRIGRMEGARKNRTPGPAYHKLGKSIRYRIDDLEDWLSEHRVTLSVPVDQGSR